MCFAIVATAFAEEEAAAAAPVALPYHFGYPYAHHLAAPLTYAVSYHKCLYVTNSENDFFL